MIELSDHGNGEATKTNGWMGVIQENLGVDGCSYCYYS